jgi:transcription antitermination factor NusG
VLPSKGGGAMSKTCELSVQVGCESSSPSLKWFAAYTATRHEKHVLEHLTDRRVESFLPLYSADRHWKKRKPLALQLPLFPNYVFVRISPAERAVVLGTPGIFSIVGSAHNAWALPEQEIEALRNSIKLRKIEPHAYLVVGERARVKSGILAGLEGIIIRNKNNLRIILTLDQIMQSVAIEVDAGELERIPQEPMVPPNYGGRTVETLN